MCVDTVINHAIKAIKKINNFAALIIIMVLKKCYACLLIGMIDCLIAIFRCVTAVLMIVLQTDRAEIEFNRK